MFDVLGLDAMEEGAYRRLLQVPSASVQSLAVAMIADESQVFEALKALEEKGLVARSTASPSHFVASPPDLGLGSLIVSRQEDIRRVQLELARLTEQYRATNAGRTDTEVVDVVRGRQAVAQRFAQLQRGAKQEVLALVKSTVAVVSAEQNVDEDIAVERGVKYRVVQERAAFERPGFLDLVRKSLQAGELVRVVSEVPLRLVIADRSLALVPLMNAADAPAGALLCTGADCSTRSSRSSSWCGLSHSKWSPARRASASWPPLGSTRPTRASSHSSWPG